MHDLMHDLVLCRSKKKKNTFAWVALFKFEVLEMSRLAVVKLYVAYFFLICSNIDS